MERLSIKKFGPIEDVELSEIRRFNVFIGESGSGKSIIMKVLAMMRWIYKMSCVRTYIKDSGIQGSAFRFRLDSVFGDNGLKPFLRPDSEIIYRNGDFVIELRKGKLTFPKKNVPTSELTLQKIAYISDKRVLIPDLAAGNVSLRHNMFYLDETFLNYQKALSQIQSSDMSYLGVRMATRKINGSMRVFVSSMKDDTLFDNLPLTSASSGMQSSVALHLIAHYFSRYYDIVEAMNSTIFKYLAAGDNLSKFSARFNIGEFPNQRISMHLEEPELSLFPSNQWGLMKYLVGECLSSSKGEMDLTMATHSPYILTALNIMILAYRACSAHKTRYMQLGIDTPMLAPEDVAAWRVCGGRCETLFDDELGLLDGTFLDSASDVYEDVIVSLNEIIYG